MMMSPCHARRRRRHSMFAISAAAATVLAAATTVAAMPPRTAQSVEEEKYARRSTVVDNNNDDDSYNAPDITRPQYHIVPHPDGWMNDPNGLMYDPVHKRYHVFYQRIIDAIPQRWGHVVSTNLVDWKQLPIALQVDDPDNSSRIDAGGIFSGSATILDDPARTPVLTYAVNTHQSINLALPANRSDPELVEWRKSRANPIISTTTGAPLGEDPTGLWRTFDRRSWLLTYPDAGPGGRGQSSLMMYKSAGDNLSSWEAVNRSLYQLPFNGQCAGFLPLPKATQQATHVLVASNRYILGRYDAAQMQFQPVDPHTTGVPFQPEGILGSNNNRQVYAGQILVDSAEQRLLWFQWIKENRKGPSPFAPCPCPWQGVQSLPVVLTPASDGVHFLQEPAPELAALRVIASHIVEKNVSVARGAAVMTGVGGRQLEIQFTLNRPPSGTFDCGISVLRTLPHVASGHSEEVFVGVQSVTSGVSSIYIDASNSSSPRMVSRVQQQIKLAPGEPVDVRVFLDHSVVEVFGAQGAVALTNRAYPTQAGYPSAALYSLGDQVCTFKVAEAWALRSINMSTVKIN